MTTQEQSEKYAPRRVTLADVASLAGVDRSVVSRVINRDERLVIKAETRERVLDAIRTLGYTPNAAARSLRTSHAGAFGLVIPDFADPIYAEIINGAEQAAGEVGCALLTGTLSQESGPDGYVELLAGGRVDGLLLAARHIPPDVIKHFASVGKPIVLLNQAIPGISRCIVLDDEAASRLAVGHLLELGHEKIGHISGPAGVDTARRRRRGFLNAMSRAGIAVPDNYIVQADYSTTGGESAMAELLSLRTPPTAVFVANVASAIGSLKAARVAGWSIPDDLSVVAVHDHPLAAYLNPALTTVRMPLRELGHEGLLSLTRADSEVGRVIVRSPMDLVVRETTAVPRKRVRPSGVNTRR